MERCPAKRAACGEPPRKEDLEAGLTEAKMRGQHQDLGDPINREAKKVTFSGNAFLVPIF
jgi:hypothetical protein